MQRNHSIDHLRGIATIAMILIHTSYYFIAKDSIALFLWNWSQFAVPMFVFCAGYVFFIKKRIQSLKDLFRYFIKRLPRLLIPYYIFALFFLPIIWFTTGKITVQYITQSIFLTSGIDINWLVLLMLELAIIFPIVAFLQKKFSFLFYVYIIGVILFSVYIFYFPLHSSYKPIMWLSWSIAGISSILFFSNIKKRIQVAAFLISLCTFIFLYIQGMLNHHDLSLINNKYPPNIFMLSYGLASCFVFFQLSERGIFTKVSKQLSFISRHSYSIYFIHYCLLIFFASFLTKIHIPWYVFFLGILLTTLAIQYGYVKLHGES